MRNINYTNAKAHLSNIIQKFCEDSTPVTINHDNQPSVVLLSLAEYSAMQETVYLLSQRANATRLLTSIAELENC